MRTFEKAKNDMVKVENSQVLRDGVEMRRRWAEYFEQVLNVEDIRDANINVVGDRMPVLVQLNARAVSVEKVKEAVNEIKSSKAPGLDGFSVECLKKGGMGVRMVRETVVFKFYNGGKIRGLAWCIYTEASPYKGKGDNTYVVTRVLGISFSRVVGKLYGRVLIKRVRA